MLRFRGILIISQIFNQFVVSIWFYLIFEIYKGFSPRRDFYPFPLSSSFFFFYFRSTMSMLWHEPKRRRQISTAKSEYLSYQLKLFFIKCLNEFPWELEMNARCTWLNLTLYISICTLDPPFEKTQNILKIILSRVYLVINLSKMVRTECEAL